MVSMPLLQLPICSGCCSPLCLTCVSDHPHLLLIHNQGGYLHFSLWKTACQIVCALCHSSSILNIAWLPVFVRVCHEDPRATQSAGKTSFILQYWQAEGQAIWHQVRYNQGWTQGKVETQRDSEKVTQEPPVPEAQTQEQQTSNNLTVNLSQSAVYIAALIADEHLVQLIRNAGHRLGPISHQTRPVDVLLASSGVSLVLTGIVCGWGPACCLTCLIIIHFI